MTTASPENDLGTPVGFRELIKRFKEYATAESAASASPEPPITGHRARLQALRPQTNGQFYAMPREDRAAFNLHCEGIVEDLNPKSNHERWLATAIAEDMWRLDRARAIENNILSVGISGDIGDASVADSPEVHAAACHARIWLRDARQLQTLALYEQRVRRNLERNENHLFRLQADRAAQRRQCLEEALLLSKVAAAEGRTFHPAEDALEGQPLISLEELARFERRESRLATGRKLQKNPGRALKAA